jgi:1,4-alpha-glucan branching enzyme
LTFSLTYAFSERFILPLSHDEVVHGKKSLINRMPGDYWQKFACLRTLFVWQMTHPGSKLTFMGGEIGQFIEWRFDEPLEWFLLDYEAHRQLQDFVRTLNRWYQITPALWEQDSSWDGFRWLIANDTNNSVFAYERIEQTGKRLVVILNETPAPLPGYTIPLQAPGRYQLILNSDDLQFGGSGYLSRQADGQESSDEKTAALRIFEATRQTQQLTIDLPPLCGMVLQEC